MNSGCSGIRSFEGVMETVDISNTGGFLGVCKAVICGFGSDLASSSLTFGCVMAAGEIGSCTPNSATSVMYGRMVFVGAGKNPSASWSIAYCITDPLALRRLTWISKPIITDSWSFSLGLSSTGIKRSTDFCEDQQMTAMHRMNAANIACVVVAVSSAIFPQCVKWTMAFSNAVAKVVELLMLSGTLSRTCFAQASEKSVLMKVINLQPLLKLCCSSLG